MCTNRRNQNEARSLKCTNKHNTGHAWADHQRLHANAAKAGTFDHSQGPKAKDLKREHKKTDTQFHFIARSREHGEAPSCFHIATPMADRTDRKKRKKKKSTK